LTAHEKEDWFDDDTDEVTSSARPPVKRQKLSDSSCEDPCVTDAVISVNPNRSLLKIKLSEIVTVLQASPALGFPEKSLFWTSKIFSD